MDCEELEDRLIELAQKIGRNNINRAIVEHAIPEVKGMDVEDAIDVLSKTLKINRKTAEDMVFKEESHAPDAIELAKTSQETGNKALVERDNVSTPEGQKGWWDSIRKTVHSLINDTINKIPKLVNSNGQRMLERFASMKSIISMGQLKSGEKVYAGDMWDVTNRQKTRKLFDDVKSQGFNGTREQFQEGLTVMGWLRGTNVESEVSKWRSYISENIDKKPMLKNALRMIDAYDSIKNYKGISEHMDWAFENLDVASQYAVDNNILRKTVDEKGKVRPPTHKDYFPNTIAVESRMADPTEQTIYGGRKSLSDLRESKLYNNGLEAMIKSDKFVPASTRFDDIFGSYGRQLGKIAKPIEWGQWIRLQAHESTPASEKVMIGDEIGFVQREPRQKGWVTPEASDGRKYQNLGNLSDHLDNIFAHPELYKWFKASLDIPNVSGLALKFLKVNRALKGVVLGGGIAFHGSSIAQKAAWLGQTHGVEGYWKMGTTMGSGLEALANKDPRVISLIEGGMVLTSHDMLANPALSRNYNFKTGEKVWTAKLSDYLTKFTNVSHELLFDKWQTGMKIGTGLRLMETDWFKGMIEKVAKEEIANGSDRNVAETIGRHQATRTLAKILNDSFGGQNLELMGRSKTIQMWLQAGLLAPDWSESKARRMFGTVFSPDENLRKSMQGTMMVELIAVTGAHFAMQQVANSILVANGQNPRSAEDTVRDIVGGNFCNVYMGKAPDGKDVRMNIAGSAREDFRPIEKIMRASLEAAFAPKAGEGFLARTMTPAEEAVKEVSYKTSPLVSIGLRMVKGEKPSAKKPSPFDIPGIPIALSQPIADVRSGAPGRAALSLAGGMVGMPVTVTGKTAKQKKAEATMRRKGKSPGGFMMLEPKQ